MGMVPGLKCNSLLWIHVAPSFFRVLFWGQCNQLCGMAGKRTGKSVTKLQQARVGLDQATARFNTAAPQPDLWLSSSQTRPGERPVLVT